MRKTIIALLITTPFFSQAASFDCTLALSVIEKTICSVESLSKADERLSDVYKEAKKIDTAVVQSQREWIKVRNKATSVEELDSLHKSRIIELERIYKSKEVKPMTRQVENPTATAEPIVKEESKKKKDIEDYIQEIESTGGIEHKDFGYLSAKEYTKGYPKWLLGCGYVMADNIFGVFSIESKKMNQFKQFQEYENEFRIVTTNMAMESMIKSSGGNMALAKLACENM